VLFAGFLAVAWLQVGAALLIVYLFLALLPGSIALQVAVPLTIATGGLLWYATVRALRLPHRLPAGVPISRADAPALWSLVDAASAAAGVAPPDGVTVVAGAFATLSERIRLGGLAGGRRDLLLGMPLLLAWDEAHMRAAVAHELAHGSPALGRFAPMAYRGRVAIGRIVRRIPRRSPAGPVLRAYARWYRRAAAPFGRAQELAADRVAAEFAGSRAALAVLRDAPALDGMQHLFHTEYLSPGWQAGYAPVDVFGGFLQVLAARADEAARLRALAPEPQSDWDTHPAVAEREAAFGAASKPGAEADGSGPSATAEVHPAEAGLGEQPSDSSPDKGSTPSDESSGQLETMPSGAAGDLVPDLPGLGRALQAVAFPPGGRAVVSWDEFFSLARNAEMEREADASLGAVSRVAGSPVTSAADILDLAADDRLRTIAKTVFGDLPDDQTAERIIDLITLLLALAALRSGAARWRHSWTGTAELVAIDGSHLDLAGPASLATDPATVADARKWLVALDIDITAARGDDRPARVPVLGGVVNIAVDGTRTDVLVIETGLVLLPSLPRSRQAEAKRRLTRWAADGILADGTPALGAPTAPPTPEMLAPATRDETAAPGEATAPGEAAASSEAAAPAESAASTPAEPAAPDGPQEKAGFRFVAFADVARASVTANGRRAWEIALRDGRTVSLRTALDSDELPGGWSALDDAVAFLAGTR
jgi:hypothetical protein